MAGTGSKLGLIRLGLGKAPNDRQTFGKPAAASGGAACNPAHSPSVGPVPTHGDPFAEALLAIDGQWTPCSGSISFCDICGLILPQAGTWLVPVSYVSRTCLVRGGSTLAPGMAHFL